MEMIDCHYWGIFFYPQVLPIGSLFNDIENKHVTFGYEKPFPAHLLGEKVPVTITGYANDGYNEAYRVEFPAEYEMFYENEAVPHITMSLEQNASAVDSGYMNFEDTDAGVVYGRFAYCDWDNQIHGLD